MIRTVFVVDDPAELLSLRHATAALRPDWDMKFFHSVEEALVSMADRPFDVVVTDMRGDFGGSEFLALVQYQHPRVIRVLVAGESEDNTVARSAGVAHRILRRPCDPAELCCAIERVFDLEQRLSDPDLQSMLGEVGELPQPSASVVRLNDVLASDDVSIESVAAVVSDDINMTTKLLQVVNSAFYGLGHHITDAREAIAYLGVNSVRDLLVANEMMRGFENVPPPVQSVVDELHEHAVAVAHLARELVADRTKASEAYVAGLLHDVGLLLLASRLPEKFLEIRVQTMRSNLSLHEVECEILGATHADLGGHFLDLWGLPSEIVEAVACHHDAPEFETTEINATHAVHIADVIAGGRVDEATFSWKCSAELDEDYLKKFGLQDFAARTPVPQT
jgi:HD-like signal output (HDOD) protein